MVQDTTWNPYPKPDSFEKDIRVQMLLRSTVGSACADSVKMMR